MSTLPSGWVEYSDASGRKYYFNETTKQTTWSKPEPVAQPEDTEDVIVIDDEPSQKDLPPNWTEYSDPQGRKYYYNSVTKETLWSRPKPLASSPKPKTRAEIVAARRKAAPKPKPASTKAKTRAQFAAERRKAAAAKVAAASAPKSRAEIIAARKRAAAASDPISRARPAPAKPTPAPIVQSKLPKSEFDGMWSSPGEPPARISVARGEVQWDNGTKDVLRVEGKNLLMTFQGEILVGVVEVGPDGLSQILWEDGDRWDKHPETHAERVAARNRRQGITARGIAEKKAARDRSLGIRPAPFITNFPAGGPTKQEAPKPAPQHGPGVVLSQDGTPMTVDPPAATLAPTRPSPRKLVAPAPKQLTPTGAHADYPTGRPEPRARIYRPPTDRGEFNKDGVQRDHRLGREAQRSGEELFDRLAELQWDADEKDYRSATGIWNENKINMRIAEIEEGDRAKAAEAYLEDLVNEGQDGALERAMGGVYVPEPVVEAPPKPMHPAYIAAEKFDGKKDGYKFQKPSSLEDVGYYWDGRQGFSQIQDASDPSKMLREEDVRKVLEAEQAQSMREQLEVLEKRKEEAQKEEQLAFLQGKVAEMNTKIKKTRGTIAALGGFGEHEGRMNKLKEDLESYQTAKTAVTFQLSQMTMGQ